MRRANYLLTAYEVLCLALALFGITQITENASRWQYQIMNDWTSIAVLIGAMVLLSILVSALWHRTDPDRLHPAHRWLQDISALYVAYMICGYAFAKLLKTQFQPPHYVLETPIGDLNGFWLTWTYFGFSEPFANILGYTQIAGSVLILFPRTRLLGSFVLIPVMVNICLIDHFYDISPLAYYNALHYTFILFLFVALNGKKLAQLFLGYHPPSGAVWKVASLHVARVLVVVLAFYKIYSLRDSFEPKTNINGVWNIADVKTNSGTRSPVADYSKLYVEWRYGALLKSDPVLFTDKDRNAAYDVDQRHSQLTIRLYPSERHPSADSLVLRYSFASDSLLTLTGVYNRDSLKMELRRIK